ncbi:MAG: hypothetical protein HYR56_04295 [Acidobacteria bacterium]|nr:hypothetical protein [Acidobacteriota bacterium]MBI3421746.1 hypothetical protein [Acidobacteriota bacterium]
MNQPKHLCFVFLFSLFALLSAFAFAQEPDMQMPVRNPQVRPQREPLPAGVAAPFVNQTAASAAPEQTLIPLGTYSFIAQTDTHFGTFNFFAGEYFLTLLPGGKYQIGRNDWVLQSGNYTVTATTIDFVSPFGNDTCSNKGTYAWQLQGNRLAFNIVGLRATDPCAERLVCLASGPMTRTDNLAKEWKNIGPFGGRIYGLFANEGKLFAATDSGGMFVSADNGQSWKATRGNRAFRVNTFAAFNGTLFAGGSGAPIFVSTDGGESWEFQVTPIGAAVYDFVESGGKFYAATLGNGVWRMGANPYLWEKTGTTGLTNQGVYSLASSGNNLFAATDGGGVYRSTDGGATWTAVNNGLAFLRIRNLAVDGMKLYASTAFGANATNEVSVSEDNGQTWKKLGNGIAADFPAGFTNGVYELAPLGGKLFAAGTSGVLMFDGTKWTQVQGGSPTVSFFSIAASGNTLYAGAWFDGVSRSTDGGVTWAKSNTGLTGRFTNTVHKDNGVLYAGVNDGIFTSRDEGQTWTRGAIANIPGIVCFLSYDGKVYAGAINVSVGTSAGVYVSSDQGATWTRASNGLGAGSVWRIINAGNTLYAAVLGSGVFRSTDGGANWTAANNGLGTLSVWDIVAQGNNLFIGTTTQGVYRSNDGGQTWMAARNGLPTGATVFSVITVGNTLLAGVNGQPVYRSEDNGQSWTRATGDISISGFTLYAYNGVAYAACDGGIGVLRSFDEGRTWQPFNAGFDARFVLSQGFHGNGNALYVASFNGIYVSNNAGRATTVSAASFNAANIAEKGLVAAFGTALATSTQSANTTPLPTTLGGTTVKVTDSNGVERPAPLFFVSSGQVNFQIPTGTAVGAAMVTITNGDGTGALGMLDVKAAAPAIFTSGATGQGAAAAVDAITGAAGPFNATQANGQPNIIAVFGTSLGPTGTDVDGNLNASTTARIGPAAAPVQYAGRAPGFTGLNQFNIQLPAGIPAGTYPLTITRGLASNTVTLTIR